LKMLPLNQHTIYFNTWKQTFNPKNNCIKWISKHKKIDRENILTQYPLVLCASVWKWERKQNNTRPMALCRYWKSEKRFE
jgi:hypothetical protein